MRPSAAFASIILLIVSTVCAAAPVQVSNARIVELADGSQLVFDISAPVKHSSFLLENPPRLVVDLSDARLRPTAKTSSLRSLEVHSVRTGIRAGLDLRIVVDLNSLVRSEAYTVRNSPQEGYRLVVDMFRNDRPVPGTIRASAAAETVSMTRSGAKPYPRTKPKEIVIAIDPGHGGKDPGATGAMGTREKHVVMQIAKRLQQLVNQEQGMRAVLTRNSDRYLRLYERIKLARRNDADLFISIHADAFPNPDAQGSSVFILSSGRASSVAARLLADRENAADKIGGVKLVEKDNIVNSVLIDMHQDATLEASMVLADAVLGELAEVGEVHKGWVERASFAVLTSPIMPSILVETGFITNASEEKKLRSKSHQKQVASAIMNGIRSYFHKRPPRQLIVEAEPLVPEIPPLKPVQLIATASPVPAPRRVAPPPKAMRQVHVIRRGESLYDVAEHYSVSVVSLRSLNGLSDNRLRMPAGTPLTIPN